MAATIPTGDNAAMDASGSARDPVELLADEFVQRRRRGERPTVAEYAERFPHLADEIRNVFPALLALEQAGASRNGGPSAGSGFPLDAAPPAALGDYRILREIGRGAMGVVYEAEQQSLDRRVALKILPWHATGSSVAVERFRREARAAARLHHTNIVPVFDVGEEGRVCYYAMQYIPGQPLDRVLTELRRSRRPGGTEERGDRGQEPADRDQQSAVRSQKLQETGRLAQGSTVEEAARHDGSRWLLESSHGHYFRNVAHIGQQVADALAYAHSRGIIHRDIKPSNLLLDAAGVVWVTDFGLAKTDDAAITRTGDLLGTLRYMAPERFRGECDARADVYSLGATLYELVTLRPVHDAADSADLIARICNTDPRPPRSLDPKVPRDLELIVLKALDRDRHDRYASAAALAEDLRRFLNDEPILGRATPLAERFTRWARRNRTLAAVMTTIAVLLVAAALASTLVSASFQSLASQERAARIETTTRLYESLVREAEAIRWSRREGYRQEVWSLLERARQLDTPAVNRDELRHEAVQSLGDFLGLPPTVISGFPAAARSMAFGDDGIAAIGLADGTIRWHAAGGELLAEQQAHFAPVERITYLADTQTFYSADSRGLVKSWERAEGRAWQPELVADVAAPLLDLVPVREGQLMAAYRRYADQSEIVVENLLQRRAVAVDPRADISAAAISHGGDQLAVACHNELLLYSTRTGDLLERTTTDLGPILGLAFNPEGRLVFCGCDQGLVVYDLPELRQQTFMRSGDVPLGTFTPDGTQLVFAGANRRVTLWNFRGNRELAVLTHPGWQELHTVALTADGRRLATADGAALRIWDLAGSGERTVLAGHAAGVTAVAYSRDPQRLASASKDRTISVWDAATGDRLAIAALPAAVQAIALDSWAMLAAAGDRDGNLRLYDGRSLHTLAEIRHSLGPIRSVCFSPSGDRLVAGGQRGIGMWAVHWRGAAEGDEELLPEDVWLEPLFEDASGVVADLQVSRDGTLLAWRDADDKPQALELNGRVHWPLSGPQVLRGEQSLAFAAGGRELLLVDRDGTLLGWNVLTDEKARGLGRPGDFSGGPLAVHPGGRWLAAARSPLQLAVWNLATREAVLTLREERAAISAAAWSTDGRQLAVGTQDGGLALWNLSAIRAQLKTLDLDWTDEQAVEGEAAAAAGALLEQLSAAIDQEPKSTRLLARRGHILAQRAQAVEALADFAAVLALDGNHAPALLGRGQLHARQGRFAEAAADVRRAVALQPADLENWLAAAVLLSQAGEAREYRDHCGQMIARFGDTADTAALERVILSCLLLPEVVSPRELPLSRLETSLTGASVSPVVRCRGWITLALASVRGGDPDRALSNIRRAQQESIHGQTPWLQALSFCVLALAQRELGQAAAARSSLEASGDFLRSLPPTTEPGVGYTFNERAVAEVLQAEAGRRLER